jgi:TonB family protein
MKPTLIAAGLIVSSVALFGSARDPSNFFYRISARNEPLKLEPVYNAPRPEYPEAARKQHLEGAGVVAIHIKPDGSVESVRVVKSTGYKILDDAAIRGFSRWRFRPRSLKVVTVPIQYAMSFSSVHWGSRSDLKRMGDCDGVVLTAGGH